MYQNASEPNHVSKNNEKSTTNESMRLYAKSEESRFVEYLQANGIRGMFELCPCASTVLIGLFS